MQSEGAGASSDGPPAAAQEPGGLQRHFGLLQATALNVTMIVGAGVFVTIPLMLAQLPGPYILLGWLVAGALMLVDGLIWSELAAAFPGSGGTYLYMLECFGRRRWGRFMAFLFIWQFLISGPLEVASGIIALTQFAKALHPQLPKFLEDWTIVGELAEWHQNKLTIAFGPAQLAGALIIFFLMFLLYRRITSLGRLTVTFWVGVLAAIAWILVEGFRHFDPAVMFDYSGAASSRPDDFGWKLGAAMLLAMYSYLGYYNVCYIGDEVRDPGRVIPRAILLSALVVCLLFVGLNLSMLGTVSWHEAKGVDNLPAEFMRRLYGPESPAVILITLLLIWSCFGSAFAALLGYSRIPYGAARYGHFFAVLGRLHPVHNIPHVSLLLVGGLTLFWSFFDLQNVINALITTRILEQFVGQIIGVVLLRRHRPELPRPYKMWLYPLPCGLALVGWLTMYVAAGLPFIVLGLTTLAAGAVVYLIWSRWIGGWPFAPTQAD